MEPQKSDTQTSMEQAARSTQIETPYCHNQLSLETVMKVSVLKTMNLPSWPIIYGTISWKLGCFYERFWCNQTHGLKRNTQKAAQMTIMVDKMKLVDPTQKGIAVMVCYAREIKKFEKQQYEVWKKFIWADLSEVGTLRQQMQKYVEAVTPPAKLPDEVHSDYQKRERKQFEDAYGSMRFGMILVQVLNKIWTLRKAKTQSDENFNKTKTKTTTMLRAMKGKRLGVRLQLKDTLGDQQWKQIVNLW